MKTFDIDEYHTFMNKHVLNPIGIDYNNLIEKGLAIEAPKDTYTHL